MFARHTTQPPTPEPLPASTARDPQAMADEPSQVWGPDDDE